MSLPQCNAHKREGKSKYSTYPVDFIENIGFQDNTADNTNTRSSLQDNLGLSKEEEEVGLNGRRVALLCNSELGTIRTKVELAIDIDPVLESRFTLSEIRGPGLAVQTWVGGAGLWCNTLAFLVQ
jgi:hypothetical protein